MVGSVAENDPPNFCCSVQHGGEFPMNNAIHIANSFVISHQATGNGDGIRARCLRQMKRAASLRKARPRGSPTLRLQLVAILPPQGYLADWAPVEALAGRRPCSPVHMAPSQSGSAPLLPDQPATR